MNPHLPSTPFAAFLFDMDGTLINSIASANRVWTRWAESHGIDPAIVLRHMHGRRVIETVRGLNVPGMDAEREAAAITKAEIEDVDGIVAIPGANAFLQSLPPDRWAIATSAPRALAIRRLKAAGVQLPRVVVTAEDVSNGKPAPDCFLLAARQLDVAATDCLVWEDTLAGVKAAEAAGASVVLITATHSEPIDTRHPSIVNYDGVTASKDASGALVLTYA